MHWRAVASALGAYGMDVIPQGAAIDSVEPIPNDDRIDLHPGVVDLWCFFYEERDEGALKTAYELLMTSAERRRCDRFRFEKDRRMFRATRALVRTVLTRYQNVAPADWQFDEGEYGKPYISGPAAAPKLSVNLTNTKGLVVCAVSAPGGELGVDAENLTRTSDTIAIADRFFSASEVRALHAQPEHKQQERFFTYWTLKESYIKARGMGLAIPLGQFSFLVDDGDRIGIAFDPRLEDDPSRWQFAWMRADPHFVIAVGADVSPHPMRLRFRKVIPLADEVMK